MAEPAQHGSHTQQPSSPAVPRIVLILGIIVLVWLGVSLVFSARSGSGTGVSEHSHHGDDHGVSGHAVDDHGQASHGESAHDNAHDADSPVPSWTADGGIWTLFVFIGLVVVLYFLAWRPWRDAAATREERIYRSIEEAKLAHEEAQKTRKEIENRLREAQEKVARMRQEAEEDAARLKEDLLSRAREEIELERQRLRREAETARDQALAEIWNQTAQMAAMITVQAVQAGLGEDDRKRLADEAVEEVAEKARHWRPFIARNGDKPS